MSEYTKPPWPEPCCQRDPGECDAMEKRIAELEATCDRVYQDYNDALEAQQKLESQLAGMKWQDHYRLRASYKRIAELEAEVAHARECVNFVARLDKALGNCGTIEIAESFQPGDVRYSTGAGGSQSDTLTDLLGSDDE